MAKQAPNTDKGRDTVRDQTSACLHTINIHKYKLKALKTSNRPTCLIIYDILTCRSKTSVYVMYQIKQKLSESDDTSSN